MTWIPTATCYLYPWIKLSHYDLHPGYWKSPWFISLLCYPESGLHLISYLWPRSIPSAANVPIIHSAPSSLVSWFPMLTPSILILHDPYSLSPLSTLLPKIYMTGLFISELFWKKSLYYRGLIYKVVTFYIKYILNVWIIWNKGL